MDQAIQYPTWKDVGMPLSFLNYIRLLPAGEIIDYLLLNRVFRYHIRSQYVYMCDECRHVKKLSRNWEDYSQCERCSSGLISSSANWRMGKDKMKSYSKHESHVRTIVREMTEVYGTYFRDYPPDNFLECDWEVDRDTLQLPNGQEKAFGRYQQQEDFIPNSLPMFSVKFCCGDKVTSPDQTLAICHAALLCPFLWDDTYDWKYKMPRETNQATHILPLIHMWCKFKHPKTKEVTADSLRYQNVFEGPNSMSSEFTKTGHALPDTVIDAINRRSSKEIADWFKP